MVSGKDLILEILRRFSCKAGIGKIMEFYGPGAAALDMAARATVANMAVDGGFMPFLMDPVNFAVLYQNVMQQQAEKEK